uniref:EDR1/CTR1/ARMC3-like peptidase-like domain-containing protein n=1 Tax=Helianthus annuus TaxID=4232 RepID=A0A251UPN8_HELAN
MHNQGIQMLGQIKHGFCHPRAILFKVPADTVGIDCRLMVGLPKEGELERTDSHRHVIVSRIRNISLLYSLLPGEPNVTNVAWGRNKNAPTEQSTSTSRLYLSPSLLYINGSCVVKTWNKLLESTSIGNEPWFPDHEWNIDYSELTVGSSIGIGFFREVF